MTTDNMTIGKPMVIIHESTSGVILHITPLSIATLRAIQLKAAEVYSYPDKKGYEMPLENAADPSIVTPAEDNPEYQRLCREADRARAKWSDWAVYTLAVSYPNFPNEGSVIQMFAPRLLEMQKVANLPEEMSDYEKIVRYIILPGNEVTRNAAGAMGVGDTEFTSVVYAALQAIPLTPAEVTEGIRFFRTDV